MKRFSIDEHERFLIVLPIGGEGSGKKGSDQWCSLFGQVNHTPLMPHCPTQHFRGSYVKIFDVLLQWCRGKSIFSIRNE